MVLHNCEICQYTTKFTTHYNNHLKSKRHIMKVEKYNEEKNKTNSKPLKSPSKNNFLKSKLHILIKLHGSIFIYFVDKWKIKESHHP